MASLRLNPVMNIIALPFALVVSVIAATTVFRNVFVTHDGFASGSSNRQYGADSSSLGHSLPRFFTGNARITTWSRGQQRTVYPWMITRARTLVLYLFTGWSIQMLTQHLGQLRLVEAFLTVSLRPYVPPEKPND
jgi:hypothetical protein